ncbi:MAG: hypothetical protein LBT37_05950 [Lactobacillaceae bacterium]|jgi:hypothetical protein|nr:hypothetical protein [Lactobacillaceae bacterium]
MKLPFSKKSAPVDEMILDDKFQFDLSAFIAKFETDSIWSKILEETEDQIETTGVESFDKTKPFASLYFTEWLLINLRMKFDNLKLDQLTLVEYDYPQIGARTKKNVQPAKEIVDRHPIDVTLNDRIVHLPQVIAEYMFNMPLAEADYDARSEYTDSILKMYEKAYGPLFYEIYQIDVMDSVEYPGANVWNKNFQAEKHVDVVGVTGIEEDLDPEPVEVPVPAPKQAEIISEATQTPVVAEPVSQAVDVTSVAQPVEKPVKVSSPVLPVAPVTPIASEPLVSIPTDDAGIKIPELETKRLNQVDELSADYVDFKLNELKRQFNEQRLSAQATLNTSAQERLAKELETRNNQLLNDVKAFDADNNVAEVTTTKVDEQLKVDKNAAYVERKAMLDQKELDDKEAEDQRHRAEITKIQNAAQAKRDNLQVAIEQEYIDIRRDRYAEKIVEVQTQVQNDKQAMIDEANQHAQAALNPIMTELKAASAQYMNALIDSQSEEMQRQERIYAMDHQKAMELENQRLTLANKNESLNESGERFGDLQDQLYAMGEANAQLKNEVASKQAEIRTLNQNVVSPEQVQEVTRLNKRIEDLQAENNAKANVSKASMSGVKAAGIGIASAATLLLIAGGAYSFEQQAAQLSKADANVKEMAGKVSELQAKQITLQKSTKAKSADTTTTPTAQTATTDTTDYTPLDTDIAANKLSVYDTSFKNQDLQTDARVLAVGKVLIMNGQTSDALSLANANQGHNQSLLAYIAELTAKAGK